MSLVSSLVLAVSAVAALQKALDSNASWTMERRLSGSDRVLTSSGEVSCKAGVGIEWKVLRPFASSVSMTTNAMVFVDEDGRREKSLDELPHYEDIRKATDAFVAGNDKAFDGVFTVEEQRLPPDGWRLVLKPEISAMRRLVEAIELSGAALPTNVVLLSADGTRSVIRFREIP